MTGGVFSRTMITAFAVVMLVAPVSGKDSPQESDIANPHVARAMQYVFPDETRSTAAPDRSAPAMSCLLYTSPSPRDRTRSRMPSSA